MFRMLESFFFLLFLRHSTCLPCLPFYKPVRFWVCRYRHTIPFARHFFLSCSVFILITIQCERVTSIKSKSPSFVALISFRSFFTRYKCVFALHPDMLWTIHLSPSAYVDSINLPSFSIYLIFLFLLLFLPQYFDSYTATCLGSSRQS